MKYKFAIVFLLSLAALSVTAAADTLTLSSVGGASSDGVYVYPYNFTANIGGVTSSMSLMCVDFNREITIGETWQVTEIGVPQDDPRQTPAQRALAKEFRALALLDYGVQTGYGGMSATDYQFAAWNIFDPADMVGKKGMTANAQLAYSLALQAADGQFALPAGFSYSNFAFFVPTADTTGWTAGTPQRFVGLATAGFQANGQPPLTPTPEPSGLLLVGTGIFGAAGVVYRRLRTAAV